MGDSNVEFEKEIEPVNAILGESFNLFPENQPLTVTRSIKHRVEVEGLGNVEFIFADWHKHPGQIESMIKLGERIVLCTDDGPVEVASGSQSAMKVIEGDFYSLGLISSPRPVDINLSFPRIDVLYEKGGFSKRWDDDPDNGPDTVYDIAQQKDEMGEISEILIPRDVNFLQKIKALIL